MIRLIRVWPYVLSLAALPVAAAASAQQAAPKFAYINSQVILDRAPGAKEAQAQFAREQQSMQASVQKLSDSLNTLIQAYQKEQAGLTAQQKEEREKGLREKQVEFDQRVGQMSQQMEQRQVALVQPIMQQIREVIEALRNEEGFMFIFDVASEGGAIVAADKNLDITDRVVARLKPIPVSVSPRADTSKAGAAKPGPAGITKPPTRPPTR